MIAWISTSEKGQHIKMTDTETPTDAVTFHCHKMVE